MVQENVHPPFEESLLTKHTHTPLAGHDTVCRPIGNYWYKAVHMGHNQYKIYDKVPIEKGNGDIVDDVLTEMFGDEWRQWE